MLQWLWDTFIWPPRCEHDWELMQRSNIYESPDDNRPCETKWLYRCKRCGKGRAYKS